MKKYIMIPQSLICNHDLGEKRVLVYSSIFFSGWNGDKISDLVSFSAYSVNRGKGKVLKQFDLLVSHLISNNYYSPDMVYIRQPERFCKIYHSEFQRIIKLRKDGLVNGKRINHANIILLLAYIRLHMIHDPHLPEMYSDLISRLSKQVEMSPRSVSSALDLLQELHIIYNEQLPRYQDSSGGWHSNVTVFVNMEHTGKHCDEYDYRKEIDRGKEILRKSYITRRNTLH